MINMSKMPCQHFGIDITIMLYIYWYATILSNESSITNGYFST